MKSSEEQSVLPSDMYKTIQRAVDFIEAGENKKGIRVL